MPESLVHNQQEQVEPARKVRLWVLSADRTGSTNQCLALAQALDKPYQHIKLDFVPLMRFLPARLMPRSYWGLTARSRLALQEQEWPDYIIASGARLINIALNIQDCARKKGKDVRSIFIHKPAHSAWEFDAVIAPFYDQYQAQNAITIQAALSHVQGTQSALNTGQNAEQFLSYARPLTLFALGGSNKRYNFVSAQKLITDCERFLNEQSGSLMLVASRRTPEALMQALIEQFANNPRVYVWDRKAPNPYLDLLALADYCIITADSANMLAEAITAGKACAIYPLQPKARLRAGKNKFALLHQALIARQSACWFSPERALKDYPQKSFDDNSTAKQALIARFSDLG